MSRLHAARYEWTHRPTEACRPLFNGAANTSTLRGESHKEALQAGLGPAAPSQADQQCICAQSSELLAATSHDGRGTPRPSLCGTETWPVGQAGLCIAMATMAVFCSEGSQEAGKGSQEGLCPCGDTSSLGWPLPLQGHTAVLGWPLPLRGHGAAWTSQALDMYSTALLLKSQDGCHSPQPGSPAMARLRGMATTGLLSSQERRLGFCEGGNKALGVGRF